MWNLPGPGIEPESPAGRFPSPGPPGKSECDRILIHTLPSHHWQDNIQIQGRCHFQEIYRDRCASQLVNNPPASAGDARRKIPGSGRSSGGVNGNPLQYSHLGNPMDRGDWRATVHGVAKSLGINTLRQILNP